MNINNNSDVVHKIATSVATVEGIIPKEAMGELDEWSAEVDRSFIASNAVAMGCSNTSGDIKAFINTNSIVMAEMLSAMKSLREEMSELKRRVEGVSNDVQVVAGTPQKEKAGQVLAEWDTSAPKAKKVEGKGRKYPSISEALNNLAVGRTVNTMDSSDLGFKGEERENQINE